MVNEQISDPWDNISDKEYVTFDMDKNNNVIEITFIDNKFVPKVSPQFGNTQYEFEVIEPKEPGIIKLFSPSSTRLMRQLKKYTPLEGKTFKMERFGEGFLTDYEIAEMKQSVQTEVPKDQALTAKELEGLENTT